MEDEEDGGKDEEGGRKVNQERNKLTINNSYITCGWNCERKRRKEMFNESVVDHYY